MELTFPSLLHRCMGKQDLARRVIVKFIVQAGNDANEIQTAIREQNASQLRLVAHRLKGSAANVSAEALRETVRPSGDLGSRVRIRKPLRFMANCAARLRRSKTQLPTTPDLPK